MKEAITGSQTAEDRTGQVQVIPFRHKTEGGWQVLVLRRNATKGGFWQPVTGGVKPDETYLDAATRETEEELGLTPSDIIRLCDDSYAFEFTDEYRGQIRTFTEHVVAIEVPPLQPVRLSPEHTAYSWEGRLGALALLRYESNQNALQHYWPIVTGEHDG